MQGLRETNRARTTQAIVDAAMNLLKDRGFDGVSVDEIAAEAGVARRTLFRYFPAKEDILLDRRRIDRAYAIGALASPLRGEDEIGLVLRVLMEIQRRAFSSFRPEHKSRAHVLAHEDPGLAACSWLFLQEVRDVVVAGLLGKRPNRAALLRTRVLAMSCIMAVDAALTLWIEGGMKQPLRPIILEVGEHLRSGFAAPIVKRASAAAAGRRGPRRR